MKATNCDGAECTVNGVRFTLIWTPGGWELVSKYGRSPVEQYNGFRLRLADAPYGLIKEFGQSVAYDMAECALANM